MSADRIPDVRYPGGWNVGGQAPDVRYLGGWNVSGQDSGCEISGWMWDVGRVELWL